MAAIIKLLLCCCLSAFFVTEINSRHSNGSHSWPENMVLLAQTGEQKWSLIKHPIDIILKPTDNTACSIICAPEAVGSVWRRARVMGLFIE